MATGIGIRRGWQLYLALFAVLALLAGCASNGGAICLGQRTNASSGTAATTTISTAYTHGSVSLLTDHSIDAPGEPVRVTFTNHLGATLYTPVPAGCPFFALQQQVGNAWKNVPDCPSPPSLHRDLEPSNEQAAFIDAGEMATDLILDDNVLPGTYRVVGAFVEPRASGGEGVTMYSSPIRFCTCAQC